SDEDIIREHFLDGELNPLVEGISYEHLLESGWALANYDHPQRRYLERGWPTPDGRIQIWSDGVAAEGADPLPAHVPEMEGQEDPLRARYPLQVLSNASHYFVGDCFQGVERLQAMQSRPTFELHPREAASRDIADGDLCRLYNDRGETFGYAVLLEAMLPGVVGTQKQFKGSNTPGGVNVNALNTEVLTDFGMGPSFYSCLAEIERASESACPRARLEQRGGAAGYLRAWRARNPDDAASDDAILAQARALHPDVFT
ncbi:MAG: molybdopterin dinucleotide binding domain-containing protein, partial [Gammaproteobacteria bacterium]